jgi:hypothetical protein
MAVEILFKIFQILKRLQRTARRRRSAAKAAARPKKKAALSDSFLINV